MVYDSVNKLIPKTPSDWIAVAVLLGAGSIALGIFKKFEFEHDIDLEAQVADYDLDAGIEYEFELERETGEHGKKRKRGGRGM